MAVTDSIEAVVESGSIFLRAEKSIKHVIRTFTVWDVYLLARLSLWPTSSEPSATGARSVWVSCRQATSVTALSRNIGPLVQIENPKISP